MELMSARLKPYIVAREIPGTVGASGLAAPATVKEFEISMDLQRDASTRLDRAEGVDRPQGGFVGFTYQGHLLMPRDRIIATAFGALVVEAVEAWDDETPVHYEVELRRA